MSIYTGTELEILFLFFTRTTKAKTYRRVFIIASHVFVDFVLFRAFDAAGDGAQI